MGYTTNGQMTDFWPDDDAETMYISTKGGSIPFSEILEKACQKWEVTFLLMILRLKPKIFILTVFIMIAMIPVIIPIS